MGFNKCSSPSDLRITDSVKKLSEQMGRIVAVGSVQGEKPHPEDCIGIIRLLCSKEGKYIIGQSIYVDGGKSVQ